LAPTPTISEPFTDSSGGRRDARQTRSRSMSTGIPARQQVDGAPSGQRPRFRADAWANTGPTRKPVRKFWELDVAAKKVVKPHPSRRTGRSCRGHPGSQSQADRFGRPGRRSLMILDAKTGEEKHKLEKSGGGTIRTAEAK